MKVMVITFFNQKGMVYAYFILQEKTINSKYFIKLIKKLTHIHIHANGRKNEQWKLHMDNVRLHVCHLTLAILVCCSIEMVPQTPALLWMIYISTLQRKKIIWKVKNLKWFRWSNKLVVCITLGQMSKNGFTKVFQQWKSHWEKCIRLGKEYVEHNQRL